MGAICTYCKSLEGGITVNLTLRDDILHTEVRKNNKLVIKNTQQIGANANSLSTTMVNAIDIAFANTIDALGYKKHKVLKSWYSYQPVTFDVRLHSIIVKHPDGDYEIYAIRNDFTSYKKVSSMRQVIKILKGLSKPARVDNQEDDFFPCSF